MNNEVKMSFSAVLENVGFSRVVASAFAAQLDPTLEELADVRTAVSEAVTNAVVHGYADGRTGEVRLECRIEGNRLTVTVADDGCGIEDIAMAMRPFYTSKPNMERSGMGFSVMQAFMDEVSVVSAPDCGTSVTMHKRLGVSSRA